MFANRYFNPRYWADRYWGTGEDEAEAEVERPWPIHVHDTNAIFGGGRFNWHKFYRELAEAEELEEKEKIAALEKQRQEILRLEEDQRQQGIKRKRAIARSDDELLLMLMAA